MRPTIFCGLFFLWALAVATRGATPPSIDSSGVWIEVINASDLVAGAGSDLTSQYESVSGTATLSISNAAGVPWRVLARRSGGTWHGSFVLSVRRTSPGTGNIANITGGTSYIVISTLDTEIISGRGNRSNIAVQYKLTGMSKNVAPNTYSSGMIFTLLVP